MANLTQEEVWNKIGADWSKYRDKPIDEVLNFLKGKKGRLLDLGCGSGRNMPLDKNFEYYGIDFSSTMLNFAKRKAERLGIKGKFFLSKAEKLNFDDEFFDVALFISTLHCIENEKIRKKSLQELYRVLKPGAEAMISVWNKEADTKLGKLEANEGFVNWAKDGITYKRYYYFYDKDELLYLLKEIGFNVLGTGIYGDEKHSKKNIVVYVRK